MSNVMDIAQERKERPAYVKFERVAVEDKAASVAAGRYVAKDVDMAYITPPYSRDIFKMKVTDWLTNMRQDVANGRMPEEWAQNYRKAYEAWKNGQELPLNGTPIKGWGVISPAMQETLIRLNILTVEDLSTVTDEGQRAIGMGSIDLKNKAAAWLAQMNDKGSVTMKMAALEQQNAQLQGNVSTLERQVRELLAVVKTQGAVDQGAYNPPDPAISASDLLDDQPEPPAVRRGRFPKQQEPQAL
jgi:hypothetical protein